ncbi:MAG: DUF2461 family protein [Bacteroidetes bacterium]|nr:DUF2461 family protein [Bacteroidota bacterium]
MNWENDLTVGNLDAKSAGLVINRDVRFSNNKDPCQTNMGIFKPRRSTNMECSGITYT